MTLNPWLEEQLSTKHGSTLSLILEIPISKENYARNIIQSIGSITSVSHIAGASFITVSIDSSKISELEKIGGTVHYNMPRGIAVTTKNGIPNKIKDKFLGDIGVSKVEVPTTPIRFILDAMSNPIANYIFIPTSKTVGYIKDTKEAISYTGKNIPVCVIDTGFVPTLFHPMIGSRKSNLYSVVSPPEIPVDGHGHGSWVSFTAIGSPFTHPVYGKCEGVAPDAISTHIKALNGIGMGTTDGVIKAMETAYNKGIKVVSMSLGGPPQGGVDDDPESKIIKMLSDEGMIFCVAAGNGGDEWSIDSPGISPSAITVGSWSVTDNDLSWFSSQGPQSEWYKNNPEAYQRDLNKYGDDLIKPDVVCYGGGRSKSNISLKDEILFNGSVGWFSPYYHKMVDGFGGAHGTSQATPHVSGLIACLLEAGIINNSQDFKNLMSQGNQKSPFDGYGIAKFSKFTGG